MGNESNEILFGGEEKNQSVWVRTDFSEKVNERRGHIVTIISQFGCFVVPWEYVMIIVPAFAQSHNSAQWMVGWLDGSVM